jgi:hypothetical protein
MSEIVRKAAKKIKRVVNWPDRYAKECNVIREVYKSEVGIMIKNLNKVNDSAFYYLMSEGLGVAAGTGLLTYLATGNPSLGVVVGAIGGLPTTVAIMDVWLDGKDKVYHEKLKDRNELKKAIEDFGDKYASYLPNIG